MLTEDQELALTGGRECVLHEHFLNLGSIQLHQLQEIETVSSFSTDSTLTLDVDVALVDCSAASVVITLPRPRNGKRITLIKVAGDFPIIVEPQVPDTLNGKAQGEISLNYLPCQLKSLDGLGWIVA